MGHQLLFMATNDSLGDRMKRYEDCYRTKLPRRVPKIIRIDGKAFHTLLKSAARPYDKGVMYQMIDGARKVLNEMGGVGRMAYIQSDECTIVLNDALSYDTQPWFDNNIQKMVSVSASLFANGFNLTSGYPDAAFDARAFILPDIDEVINNLIWRQNDATRNSIQQFGRSFFSHKQLDGLSNEQVQEEMFQKFNFNWSKDADTWTKRGVVITRTNVDWEIPKFTENRDYLINLYNPTEEEANESKDRDSGVLGDTNTGAGQVAPS